MALLSIWYQRQELLTRMAISEIGKFNHNTWTNSFFCESKLFTQHYTFFEIGSVYFIYRDFILVMGCLTLVLFLFPS